MDMTFERYLQIMYGKGDGQGLLEVSQLKRESPDIYNQYDQRCKRVDFWRQRTSAKAITPENFLEMEKMADGFILLWGEENA